MHIPIAYEITYILIGEPFLWAKQFRKYDFSSLGKVTGGNGCSKIGAYWKIGPYGDVEFEYRRMSLFSRKYSILLRPTIGLIMVWYIVKVSVKQLCSIRRQSVDSLNGGFFTRGFCAVGRSGKKKRKKKRAISYKHTQNYSWTVTQNKIERNDIFHPILRGHTRVGISVSADIAHIGKTDISVSASIPADMQYR